MANFQRRNFLSALLALPFIGNSARATTKKTGYTQIFTKRQVSKKIAIISPVNPPMSGNIGSSNARPYVAKWIADDLRDPGERGDG